MKLKIKYGIGDFVYQLSEITRYVPETSQILLINNVRYAFRLYICPRVSEF